MQLTWENCSKTASHHRRAPRGYFAGWERTSFGAIREGDRLARYPITVELGNSAVNLLERRA